MRLAILNTCDDDSEYAKAYPDDGARFATLLGAVRPGWAFESFKVFENDFPERPEDFDGFLVTGSPASVNDGTKPWIARLFAFLRARHGEKRPLFGACFGHQAIAKALGGAVGPNPGSCALGITETRFHKRKPWMEPAREAFGLYSANYEQVTALPPGAEAVASDSVCPAASFIIGDHVFTTQYHPEMKPDFVADMIDHMVDDVPPEVIAKGRADLSRAAEGPAFAEWMARFFEHAAAR